MKKLLSALGRMVGYVFIATVVAVSVLFTVTSLIMFGLSEGGPLIILVFLIMFAAMYANATSRPYQGDDQ